jgi:uncharacterized protein YbbC (DUF1343 family)
MSIKYFILSVFLFFNNQLIDCSGSTTSHAAPVQFKLGNEILLSDKLDEIKSKRVALLTNQTGILPDGIHIIDAMVAKGINVVKIFSPEHGIRGNENYSEKDDKTGIPIVSLYNGKTKPSASDLSDVDVLIYDIQDVGARFYTYTSTLYYAIEACVQNNNKIIVCDRPIVINPDYVDGFSLEGEFQSFVGMIPTPVCYGLTCGELASFINGSFYGGSSLLEVIKMTGYTHSTDFSSLKLTWVKPSPNMFTANTAVCYPGTCFLEGTNVSEGRGTDKPFENIGAPWVSAQQFADELNSYGLSGVTFEPITFTPSEKISNYPPKFFGKECNGVFINVSDKNKFEAVKCGVAILVALNKLFPDFKFNKDSYIDKLAGTDTLRKYVKSGAEYSQIIRDWEKDLSAFKDTRSKYLLYN